MLISEIMWRPVYGNNHDWLRSCNVVSTDGMQHATLYHVFAPSPYNSWPLGAYGIVYGDDTGTGAIDPFEFQCLILDFVPADNHRR
jgi:hypothetical protein